MMHLSFRISTYKLLIWIDLIETKFSGSEMLSMKLLNGFWVIKIQKMLQLLVLIIVIQNLQERKNNFKVLSIAASEIADKQGTAI